MYYFSKSPCLLYQSCSVNTHTHTHIHTHTYILFFFLTYVQEDPESQALSESDRSNIKAGILRLMLGVPTLVQRQVSQALGYISTFDYPHEWPTLLPEISSELRSAQDINVLIGLLETVQAV